MEKLVYVLWRDPCLDPDAFCGRVRGELAAQLVERGAHGVVVNVADAGSRGAAPEFHACAPSMEAFVSIWLDSANHAWRKPFDEAVSALGGRMAIYAVSASQPMHNTRFPVAPGERTPGFVQIALFRRPPRVARETWLDIWLESHTRVAIDTQDTFLYVQNVVGRALNFDAPRYDAIVEEGFPPAAFGDIRAFYDAPDDEAKYRRNEAAMRESCARFIDFDKLDVVQTSQYVIKAPAWEPPPAAP